MVGAGENVGLREMGQEIECAGKEGVRKEWLVKSAELWKEQAAGRGGL